MSKEIERTRVITAQITIIEKIKDKDDLLSTRNQDESIKKVAATIKKHLNADDVQIKSVKDFVLGI